MIPNSPITAKNMRLHREFLATPMTNTTQSTMRMAKNPSVTGYRMTSNISEGCGKK